MLGNVTDDLGNAQNFAARRLDGRQGERNVDPLPVLLHPHGLVLLHPPTIPDPLKKLYNLIGQVRRGQHRYIITQNFGVRVAIDSLRAVVPAQDRAIQRHPDDPVVGRLHNGSEANHRFFPTFPLRDVHYGPDHGRSAIDLRFAA